MGNVCGTIGRDGRQDEQAQRQHRGIHGKPAPKSVWFPGATLRRSSTHEIYSLAVLPDGEKALLGSLLSAEVVDVRLARIVAHIADVDPQARSVAAFADGERVMTASYTVATTWQLGAAAPAQAVSRYSGTESIQCIAIFPCGEKAIVGNADKTITIWDVRTSQVVATLLGHRVSIRCVAVFPDGQAVVTGDAEGVVIIWDVSSTKVVKILREPRLVQCVDVFPCGGKVITAGAEGIARVWDAHTAGQDAISTLSGHESWIKCVAVFPDGERAATGSNDATARVWDIGTASILFVLSHSSQVSCLAILPDGATVLTGTQNGEAKLWHEEARRPLQLLAQKTTNGLLHIQCLSMSGEVLGLLRDVSPSVMLPVLVEQIHEQLPTAKPGSRWQVVVGQKTPSHEQAISLADLFEL